MRSESRKHARAQRQYFLKRQRRRHGSRTLRLNVYLVLSVFESFSSRVPAGQFDDSFCRCRALAFRQGAQRLVIILGIVALTVALRLIAQEKGVLVVIIVSIIAEVVTVGFPSGSGSFPPAQGPPRQGLRTLAADSEATPEAPEARGRVGAYRHTRRLPLYLTPLSKPPPRRCHEG